MKNTLTKLCLLSVILFFLSSCAEEAQPYEESNITISTPQEKGHIDTH